MTLEALSGYPEQWARVSFGAMQAKQIAALVTRYGQLSARRKPELIDPATFPLGEPGPILDGGEFGAIVSAWESLESDMLAIKAKVPDAQRDAFFQLVEHPIIALGNLYQLYYAVAWNRALAAEDDLRANIFADRAEAAFKRDQEIAAQYHSLNNGKWHGMMLQTHIGYTSWQQPEKDLMPAVRRVSGGETPKSVAFAPARLPVGASGEIVIEATRYSRAHDGKGLAWRVVPNLGRGKGAVVALPQGQPATTAADAVHLEYEMNLPRTGDTEVLLHLSPTLNTSGGVDLRIGVSIDNGAMQALSMRLVPSPDPGKTPEQKNWEQAVIDNNFVLEAKFPGMSAGRHTIKVWRLDDNVLLQRIIVKAP
jgi:hypothetical protein